MNGGPSNWPVSPVPNTFPGFGAIPEQDSGSIRNSGQVIIPNTVGVAVIPGPALGYLRMIVNIAAVNATSAAAATLAVRMLPVNLFMQRATAIPFTQQASSAFAFSFQQFCLAFDETIEVANTGAGDAILWYTYFDVLAAGKTVVRGQFSSEAPLEVIPAAPEGIQHRIMMMWSTGTALRPVWACLNDDTANAQMEVRLNGATILRTSSVAAGGYFTAPGAVWDLMTTLPVVYRYAAAAATRPGNVFLTYEALPR